MARSKEIKLELKLTKNELIALNILVWANYVCDSGCVYSEAIRKGNCEECEFTKARYSLIEKLEKLDGFGLICERESEVNEND